MVDRLAIAQKALAEAEARAGLRVVRAGEAGRRATVAGEVSADAFPVPAYLAGALPQGLMRRGVVNVQGSSFLMSLLAAVASRQGAWIAVLADPEMGWSCAESLGVDTSRVAVVEKVEANSARVVSAAVDGFDVVIVGNVALDNRERRVLQRRTLSQGALLLGRGWVHASLNVECQLVGMHGVTKGRGHIRAADYQILTPWGQARVRYSDGGSQMVAVEPTGLSLVGGQAAC
ncbi:hypothetical protein [Trueperella pecoris]|uniref:Protein RecA n=1 Tax=Trueperella pecoris TaxID=2733571 RepID=A0A7M1QSF3_9ACTO|nr:hypothetical protein [Trueperella pecoris]QOQ38775.1 hypothetical protein HLG82_04485 [Trueperella pecoris]QOR44731.1 hypothetical protein INS88_05305 [Trueperella pecoris]QTG74650.1 hypothetical protein J4179_05235 [Trueperella pecoris]